MNKEELKDLIEPFIWEKLLDAEYELKTTQANRLLTWNRLDLGFKLFYLYTLKKNVEFATKIYNQDIKAQTLGSYEEFGNENKKTFNNYVESFEKTYRDIELQGFDHSKSIVPLSASGTILNGAHRIASAIYSNKKTCTLITNEDDLIIDYKYFFERNIPEEDIEIAINKFIEHCPDNIYIAFLWPSGNQRNKESISKFKNIVYHKRIKLSYRGAFNLLYELYNHMDWVGNPENGFSGIKKKLIECFPVFDHFSVIAFQADSIDEVLRIKKEVRDIYKIGFSSIHITDTKNEAVKVSKLIFNNNGFHFLNNSNLFKYPKVSKQLNSFKQYLNVNGISSDDIVVDGSLILALYGIRDNEDLDFLASNDVEIDVSDSLYETHDTELKYHRLAKEDLIYNPNNYFIYNELKFISFKQLFEMKKERNEDKDAVDCRLMESLMSESLIKKYYVRLHQFVFYMKIKITRDTVQLIIKLLKNTIFYRPAKSIYNFVKRGR